MSTKQVIAYQGEPGANSHIACNDMYPDWEPLPCASFEDAFAAISDGTAALYKCMGGFATNGVNMTKLESYMVDGEFSATQFLADVDGHPDDQGLKLALEELAFFSREVKILGVYPAHPFRIETQNRGA